MTTPSTFFAGMLFAMLSSTLAQGQNWSPDQVYYGHGGRLTYTPDEQGNIIPDFSHVGYRYGDEPIPEVPVRVVVAPADGDDGALIQAAIDSVASLTPDGQGFRGAVLLKAGTYEVSGQLVIGVSGVVLRGEGDTDAGTVIVAAGTGDRDLIKVGNGSGRIVETATRVSINEDYVPVGRKYVVVTNASGYGAGDQIVLYRPGTAQWISDIKMDQITPSEGTVQWSPSSYAFYFERLVTRVSGDTLFFRNPVVMAMESKYGGGSVYKFSFNRLENVGIENICLKSAYAFDTDEMHSWKAIAIYSLENGWVRDVTSWYFAYSCVSLERESRLITVENCHSREPKSIITGSRRYSFNLVGSLNLFKGCTTTEGRHDFVTGSRVCGPNVFTQCSASGTHADIGPHHRWAMGTLFDGIVSDGEINVQDRDDMGSGHGWAGANQVFWNCRGSSSICQSPWTSAKNYNFGFQGEKESGARSGRPDGVWIGQNLPGLFPPSLYEAQLEQRIHSRTLFSALPRLEQVNDSSFILSFTLPLTADQVIHDNFTIGGSAGAQNRNYGVAMNDAYSVLITFSGLGILPALSTIIIGAENLTSAGGEVLEGLVAGTFTEPDKRPVVTGVELTVNNEDGFVVASSTKPGRIYIIKYGEPVQTRSNLDSLVEINLGRMAEAADPGVSVPIYTQGLIGGFYNYYAVDQEGRVSLPGTKWVTVQQTGPALSQGPAGSEESFRVYQDLDRIILDPGAMGGTYALDVFALTGTLLYHGTRMRGMQRIPLSGHTGLILIRVTSGQQTISKKITIF